MNLFSLLPAEQMRVTLHGLDSKMSLSCGLGICVSSPSIFSPKPLLCVRDEIPSKCSSESHISHVAVTLWYKLVETGTKIKFQ